MNRWKSARAPMQAPRVEFLSTQTTFAALTAGAAVTLALTAFVLPAALVMPVLCLAAIAAAGTVALFAWLRDAARHSDRITAWDVAGGFALIGFAAAMLSDSEQFVQIINLGATTH